MQATPNTAKSAIETAVTYARLSPDWFVKNILRNVDKDGNSLNDPWLDEILEAIADLWRAEAGLPTKVNHALKNQFTIRSGHGPGKTYGLAQVMHYVGFCWQSQFVCIAPKEKLILTRLWPRFRTILARAIKEYRSLINVRDSGIIWNRDKNWAAVPETANSPEGLAGYHTNTPHDWLVIIVDETTGVREDFFPVLYGAMSQPHTILIMISNPTQTQGEFYKSHKDPRVSKDFFIKHIRYGESRYTDPKWADKLRARFGENSPIYRIRVLGEFSDMGDDQLIAYDWLVAAKAKQREPDGSRPRHRLSIDVADGGECETVITYGIKYNAFTLLKKQWTYSFPSSEAPIKAAQEAIRLFDEELKLSKDEDDFVVDAVGVGAGTAGYLLDKGYKVVPYKGGAESDNKTEYRNRRTQSYIVFRNGVRDGWIVIDDDFTKTPESEEDDGWDEFCAQCCSIKRKPGTERLEEIETKKDMTARGVKSPDRADSVVMQFATQIARLSTSTENATADIIAVGEMESARGDW